MDSCHESSMLIFAKEAPVRGAIVVIGNLLIATLDKRAHELLASETGKVGIGAFDRKSGDLCWTAWGLPPLAATTSDTIYAYSRAGFLVALNLDGDELWHTTLPDDRSIVAVQRGDLISPFIGDVVVRGSVLFVAAGSEILKLSAADGSILARKVVCHGNRGIVSRLAAGGKGNLVATCTIRTEWDDEEGSPILLWSTPMPLARHRIASGDTVVLSEDLTVRYCIPAPSPSFAHLDHRPMLLDDDSVALSGAKIIGESNSHQLSIFEGWLFVLETDTGNIRWLRQIESGAAPVAAGSAIYTGLALFSIADGSQLWQSDVSITTFDAELPAIFDGERLLFFVSRGAILALDLRDRQTSDIIKLSSQQFHGRPTTILARADEHLFMGISEAGKPTRLLGIRLGSGFSHLRYC